MPLQHAEDLLRLVTLFTYTLVLETCLCYTLSLRPSTRYAPNPREFSLRL